MNPVSIVKDISLPAENDAVKIQRDEQTLEMPKAKQIRMEHDIHDDTRVDFYHWMRDKEDPDLKLYCDEWNTFTKHQLKELSPLADTLYNEFMDRLEHTSSSVPAKIGEYFYYYRMEKDREHRIICRSKEPGGREEILLDVNEEAKKYDYLNVCGPIPSPNGQFIIYGYDTDGSQFGSLKIQEAGKEGFLEIEIPNTDFEVEWNAHSNGFWYLTLDSEKTARYVHYHQMGTNTADDLLCFTEEEESFIVSLDRDPLHRHILIVSQSSDSNETRVGSLNEPHEGFKVIKPRVKDFLYDFLLGDGEHFVQVTKNKENARLYKITGDDLSFENWTLFLDQDKNTEISEASHQSQYLSVVKRENGLPKLAYYNKKKKAWFDIPLPTEIGDVWLCYIDDYSNPKIRYRFESPSTPLSTYEFDTSDGSIELLKQTKAGTFDPSQFEAKRIFARADDGTEIPISIFHKKGIELDGSNPFYLYGYGAYGITIDPYFSILHPSLMERGVICGIAHVRGSSYFGRAWYEEGKLLKKKNTFTDFINCAEHLIKEGYTNSDRLVISGGSAGGLLMGAVLNFRPDLFKAAYVQVPFVDVVTTMLDTTLPLTKEEWKEWGNPTKKEDYTYIKSYSPVDNVCAQDYPALFIESGFNDEQVRIHEPAKWVAKLYDYKTDHNPILFQINMKAGHHGASGRYENYSEKAPKYAFMLSQMGIRE